MPDGLAVMKASIDGFIEIQEYMSLAKEDNAQRTYAQLKKKYFALKAILQVAGIDLTDIDEIKE